MSLNIDQIIDYVSSPNSIHLALIGQQIPVINWSSCNRLLVSRGEILFAYDFLNTYLRFRSIKDE